MSTQMYFILFIQTCIEKCDYLFSTDENWEKEKDAGFTSISGLLSPVLSSCKLHVSLRNGMLWKLYPVEENEMINKSQRDNLALRKIALKYPEETRAEEVYSANFWSENLRLSRSWSDNVTSY